jgi:hypothetical protein
MSLHSIAIGFIEGLYLITATEYPPPFSLLL